MPDDEVTLMYEEDWDKLWKSFIDELKEELKKALLEAIEKKY